MDCVSLLFTKSVVYEGNETTLITFNIWIQFCNAHGTFIYVDYIWVFLNLFQNLLKIQFLRFYNCTYSKRSITVFFLTTLNFHPPF